MTRGRLRARVVSARQSGLGVVGVVLGVGLTTLAWHAAHSRYAGGYVLASPSKDAHLHEFGWGFLPVGLALISASLVLAMSGFRHPMSRWSLRLSAALVIAGLGLFVFAAVQFNSLSAVCACTSG